MGIIPIRKDWRMSGPQENSNLLQRRSRFARCRKSSHRLVLICMRPKFPPDISMAVI